MDLPNVLVLKISETERIQNEAFIREILRKSHESVKQTVEDLKKAGYSDQEIDLFFNA